MPPGRHARSRQKFVYWRHHNNSAFGSWYQPDKNYSGSRYTPDDAGFTEPTVPPWWHFPWDSFNPVCASLLFGCRSFFHLRCWCRLRHRLSDLSVSFSIIYSRLCCLLSKRIILSNYGLDNSSFSFYTSDFWRRAPILGDDCSWVLAASAETRSVDRHIKNDSSVCFLPSSFNVPSSQQIWPCVQRSQESRSGDNSSKLKTHLNRWGSQLSALLLSWE